MKPFGRSDVSQYYLCCKSVSNSGLFWIVLGVVIVSLAIYAMVSISASHMERQKKIAWFAIVVLIPFVGPLAYFLLRSHR